MASADSRVAMTSLRGACVEGMVETGGIEGRNRQRFAVRRGVLRGILASALGAAVQPADAQRASGPGASRPAQKRADELPLARDLAADAAAVRRERIPLVLFFDRDNCPYCERALREYLVPMSREGRWRTDARFRQIEIDRPLQLVDFSGAATTHRDFAMRHGVSLSPTVLVVDADGTATGSPIVGLTTVDFYGAYLENAFEAGLAKARAR
jgi:hypothetical protein